MAREKVERRSNIINCKKRERKKVEEYRRITLMATLYKIYAMVLAGRLETEGEEKKVIPQNQTGFRKGMGTMDNIYIINYIINKQLGKGKKMFVGLKAAFDSVDRGVLVKTMRERGIRERLVERVGKVLGETRSRVRVGGETGGMLLDGKRGKTGMSIKLITL